MEVIMEKLKKWEKACFIVAGSSFVAGLIMLYFGIGLQWIGLPIGLIFVVGMAPILGPEMG
jgi:hypothetical protein